MKSWRKYPKGDPDIDRGLLNDWLQEDLAAAGLPTQIDLTYAAYEDTSSGLSVGKALLSVLTGEGRVWGAHSYHTIIPGAPWPMELVIVTTDKGHVASLAYAITSHRTFPHEIRFVKEKFLRSGKFDGDGAKELNKNKALVKQMRANLSATCYVPKRTRFGLTTPTLPIELFLDPAYYRVSPAENGSNIIVFTQVFPPRNLSIFTLGYIPIYKGHWSLGVAQVIQGVALLESLA